MVVDTSALIALLLNESTAGRLLAVIDGDPLRRTSAATLVEASIVMQARYGDPGERELDVLLRRLRIEIVPVTEEQAELARSAFRRFGRGRHAASLNFGDCFSYALAVSLGEPLLCTGDDFTRTDVPLVPY